MCGRWQVQGDASIGDPRRGGVPGWRASKVWVRWVLGERLEMAVVGGRALFPAFWSLGVPQSRCRWQLTPFFHCLFWKDLPLS